MNNGAFQYLPPKGTTDFGAANADNGYPSMENMSTDATANFTYDGNQNMTFDGVNTLTYDVENRLVEAQNAAWGTSTYLYDPLGRRKQKQVVDGAYTVTTQFVLAGGQEIADYNGTGVGTAWVLTVRGAGGLPVASITPSASGSATVAAYYHHDVMGSTVAATEPGYSGAAMVFNYSDFGVPGAGSGLSYTYAGYRYDAETGLYYVNARYYNPNLGRFLQTDPIGLQGGTNLYAYVGNDPINLIDPSGHCAQWASQSPDMSIFGNSTPNVVLGPQLSYTVIGDKAPNGSGGYQPAQDVAFNVTTSVAGLIVQQVTFSGSGPSVPPTYYETFSVSAQGVVTPANAGGYQDTQGLVPPATNDILAAQYSGQTITATAAFYPGLQLSNPAMAGFAQGNVPQAGILPSSYTAPNLPNPNSPTTATSLPVTRVFTSP